MKIKIIIGLLVFLVGIGIINLYFTNDREVSLRLMDDYRERQVERDSVAAAYKTAFDDMRIELDSVRKERNLYKAEVDGTLVVIERLTQPEVTDETIDEALEWIDHYNDTL